MDTDDVTYASLMTMRSYIVSETLAETLDRGEGLEGNRLDVNGSTVSVRVTRV
jgi:hypothetical protein